MRDERDGACHLLSSDTDIITTRERGAFLCRKLKIECERLLLLGGAARFLPFERVSRGVGDS